MENILTWFCLSWLRFSWPSFYSSWARHSPLHDTLCMLPCHTLYGHSDHRQAKNFSVKTFKKRFFKNFLKELAFLNECVLVSLLKSALVFHSFGEKTGLWLVLQCLFGEESSLRTPKETCCEVLVWNSNFECLSEVVRKIYSRRKIRAGFLVRYH